MPVWPTRLATILRADGLLDANDKLKPEDNAKALKAIWYGLPLHEAPTFEEFRFMGILIQTLDTE